jgi:phosphinothricin acetyltransferase
MKIRAAQLSDLDQITEIFNEAIKWGSATAFREPFTPDSRTEWFLEHQTGIYKIFVSEDQGKITGYLSIGPYRKGREAFRHTAEVSYFVDFQFHRKGVATRLMEVALQHCQKNEIHNLIAFLMAHNQPSVIFMKKFGFDLWGLLPKTLTIDGKEYDHAIYGKRL